MTRAARRGILASSAVVLNQQKSGSDTGHGVEIGSVNTGALVLPKYGISTGANPSNAVLDQVAAIGADYVRFDYPAHDATNQARVNYANSLGLKMMLIVPRRAPGTDGTTWATYWSTRLSFRWWEIYNEPDLNGYTAATYAAEAKLWMDQIRAADPQAIISSAGIFKGGDVAGKRPPDFAQAMINAGCVFDVFNSHLMDDGTWNNPNNGWHYCFPHGDRAAGDTVREKLDANGRSNVPIICSEIHPFWNNNDAAQASTVTAELGYADAPITPQDRILPSVAVYRMNFSESGTFDSSLLNSDGTKRQAWTTFQNYVATH